METLSGPVKVKYLHSHTYRKGYLRGLGRLAAHFQMLGQLASAGPMKCVRRPAVHFQLAALADTLMRDFGS